MYPTKTCNGQWASYVRNTQSSWLVDKSTIYTSPLVPPLMDTVTFHVYGVNKRCAEFCPCLMNGQPDLVAYCISW